MDSFLNILIFGAPGTGKGTQSSLLAEKYNLLKVSPGEIMRKVTTDDAESDLSKKILSYIDAGNLVPADIVNSMIFEYIDKNKFGKKGVIFDGYPRSEEQNEFLISKVKVDIVINIAVLLDSLVDRLTNRLYCNKCSALYNLKFSKPKKDGFCDKCDIALTKRKDDEPGVIKDRFVVFKTQSEPVLNFYKKINKVEEIDGDRSVDVVFDDISLIIDRICVKKS